MNRRFEDFEDSLETSEEVNSIICGKLQSAGLRLNLALRIVTWAQCELCSGLVLLKFCTVEEEVGDSYTFHCPTCKSK